MSIESILERIADTLDAVAAKQGVEITKKGPGRPAGSGKAAASTPDLSQTSAPAAADRRPPAPAVAKVPSREEVQTAVTAGITAGQRDAVIATLAKFGGKNVSTCKAEDFAAIKAELDALAFAD
jgi:hypothetical protein